MASLAELCIKAIIGNDKFVLWNQQLRELPVELLQRVLTQIVASVQSKVISHTVPLKVRLIQQNRLITFGFKLHGTVQEAVQAVRDKVGDCVASGENPGNYGLFQQADNFRNSRWLREDRTLSFYDVKPGDILEFKIKQTMIKVQLRGPWTTTKTFIVDESKTASEIVQHIAPKLGIGNPEEFCLQLQRGQQSVWLNPHESLPEQGVDPLCCTLLLRKAFFFRDESVNESGDKERLNATFCQSLDTVLGGVTPVSLSDAVKLAALQCQVRFGDCAASAETAFVDDLSWREYLPPNHLAMQKKVERDLIVEYRALAGMNQVNGKYAYLQHVRSLPTHGFTFFPVEQWTGLGQSASLQSGFVGFSAQFVVVLDADLLPVSKRPLSSVVHWRVLNNLLAITYFEHVDEFLTTNAQTISRVIAEYVEAALRDQRVRKSSSGTLPVGAEADARGRVGRRTTSPPLHRHGHAPALSRSISPPRRFSFTKSWGRAGSDESLAGTSSRGLPKRSSMEELSPFASPKVRRSPLYVDPNEVHVNPLCPDAVSGSLQPNEYDSTYYLRMIRSLSCLLNSLASSSKLMSINVKFPDKSVKALSIVESSTVMDLAFEIGEKVGIRNAEEFSLQRESLPDVWLNPYQTLREQHLEEGETLLFKKKFHYNDAFVISNDPVHFNLLFCQSRDAVRQGVYPCTLDEAAQLAATQFQINFGDHNPDIHKPGFLNAKDLRFFLPPEALEFWGVTFQKLERMIYKEHQKLRGLKEEYAKFRYLQLCRKLRTYGTVFFTLAKLLQHKGRAPSALSAAASGPLQLGFSRDSILFLTPKTKKVLAEFPLSHLRKWEGDEEAFTLDFGDYEEGCFLFSTAEGHAISKYLSDYLDFIQKSLMATHTFNSDLVRPTADGDNFFLSGSNAVCCWENGKRVFTSSFWDAEGLFG